MKLDMSSVEYVVFDEADRLFELGFASAITELLHGLPMARQTLLFSATLPKSLVEFARAGLQEPKLVRLDSESKVSPDLQNSFFTVKAAEKEGALLSILQDVIRIPTGPTEAAMKLKAEVLSNSKKRRRTTSIDANTESPTQFSTIVFAATKHHVEYIATLLQEVGYEVSYVYGALDQTARKMHVQRFRDGLTNVLVVTDVAARGVDIPVLANVINYDFPSQPKIFVHRVGRTARAGRKGWSYNLVQEADMPYLVDLQLFLSKQLIFGSSSLDGTEANFTDDLVVGALPRAKLGSCCEFVTKLLAESVDLSSLRDVSVKGEKLYTKTRNAASSESVKRAKKIAATQSTSQLNPLFQDEADVISAGKEDLLARLRGYRPQETVFEIGKRGVTDPKIELLRNARSKLEARRSNFRDGQQSVPQGTTEPSKPRSDSESDLEIADGPSDDGLEVFISKPESNQDSHPTNFEELDHFMSYTPREANLAEERAYGVHSGSNANQNTGNFLVAAGQAAMDLASDDFKGLGATNQARMRWDKRSKKYVSRTNDEDGSKGTKLVQGESGLKIAASLRSGRFDAWRKSNRVDRLPRVGETETSRSLSQAGKKSKYRHNTEKAPKEADKFRDDYHVRKKRVAEAKEKRIGRFKEGSGKNELRSVDFVRKQRKQKENRRLKNGR
jgi:ATP-dependent RNA helicase DDX54/DBP10